MVGIVKVEEASCWPLLCSTVVAAVIRLQCAPLIMIMRIPIIITTSTNPIIIIR